MKSNKPIPLQGWIGMACIGLGLFSLFSGSAFVSNSSAEGAGMIILIGIVLIAFAD